MPFIAINQLLGEVDITGLDTVGPGPYSLTATNPGAGRMNFYGQTVEAYDGNLGGAEFTYAKFSGTIPAGTVVEFTPALVGGQLQLSATAWAGTANSGKPLGVAQASGVVGQFGWFQVQGNAIVSSATAPTAGAPVYWSSTGTVGGTATAGKQVLNAQYVTTSGVTIGQGNAAVVLTATQAVVYLGRSFAQGAIT